MLTLDPLHESIGFLLTGGWLGYVSYQIERHRQPPWLHLVLVAKVIAGWIFGWLYASYYCHGDTLKAYLTAGRIFHYLWAEPQNGIALLFRELSPQWEARGWEVFFRDIHLYGYDYEWSEPSNYVFYRLIVPLYAAAGGSYYGLQSMAALVGGLLSYAAYRRWQKLLHVPTGIWVIWFLMPSALLWTSGALRDTIALPLMLYGAAWTASVHSVREAIGVLSLIVLGFLRVEAVPVALGIGFLYRWAALGLLTAAVISSFIVLGWIIGPWSYAYRTEALNPAIHPDVAEASVFFLHYQPTFWGSIIGWIKALPYGLLGPFPWQIKKPLLLLYGLEVWAMGALGLYWMRRGRWNLRAVLLIGAGLFIIGVIAMAMPYWGTLARQRLYGLYFMILGIALALKPALEQTEHRPSQP
ncbi:MAG: hypothetical protein N2253_01520 [Bacteroidia bacterium]|nr:hypothetical protein [Bacteroidia bacterium]MCX7763555.1 hypothetical protein [Bacteroidia bacterium]MDW8057895.1 hypothetical protein [Bacteroidia bacterium]